MPRQQISGTTKYLPWEPIPVYPVPPPPIASNLWIWASNQLQAHRLLAVDVSNLSSPTLTSNILLTDGEGTAPYNFNIGNNEVIPKNILVTSQYIIYPFWTSSLMIRNNNTSNPSLVTNFTWAGGTGGRIPIWKGNTAIVATATSAYNAPGVATIDMTNPASPSLIGVRTHVGYAWNTQQQQTMAAMGTSETYGGTNTFYLPGGSFSNATANTSDISTNPPGAFAAENLGANSTYLTFATKGKYLYAVATQRVYAFDASTNTPTATGFVTRATSNNDATLCMFIHNNCLVLISGACGPTNPDITIWSLSDPTLVASPSPISTINPVDPGGAGNSQRDGHGHAVCFSGNYLFYVRNYNTSGNTVLYVYDLSNPTSPILMNGTGTILVVTGAYIPMGMACQYPSGLEGNNYIVS